MPRNMSFSLTTQQIRHRTKTVTRRRGWRFLKPGDVLNACVKCQGLKPGEKIERLGQIRVLRVTREQLDEISKDWGYGKRECEREGFPKYSPDEFVAMFCEHMGGDCRQEVTRIQFEYLNEVSE
jgi:hypothetical protein